MDVCRKNKLSRSSVRDCIFKWGLHSIYLFSRRDLNYIINKKTADLYYKRNLLTAYISDKNLKEKELFYGHLVNIHQVIYRLKLSITVLTIRLLLLKVLPALGKLP